MSRSYGSSLIPVALFLTLFLIVLPVCAANVTTETTTVIPTANVTATETTTVIPTANVTATETTNVTSTTTVATIKTTAPPPTTTVMVTPLPTTVTTIPVTETPTTGSLKIFSSPAGASILIDGVYVGTTPGTVNGVSAGNHILRLTLSGYYDYEGSIYVLPGQTNQGYGTLQPMNRVTATPTTIPTVIVPVIVPVVTAANESTANPGLFGNSSVVVAIIGVVTALIAAGASVFTHVKPPKKE
jgi:hypothetical protein